MTSDKDPLKDQELVGVYVGRDAAPPKPGDSVGVYIGDGERLHMSGNTVDGFKQGVVIGNLKSGSLRDTVIRIGGTPEAPTPSKPWHEGWIAKIVLTATAGVIVAVIVWYFELR